VNTVDWELNVRRFIMHINKDITHGNQMKLGYIILFLGIGSFVTGVVVFLVFAELRAATDVLMEENTVQVNKTIGPDQSLKISSQGTNTQSNFSVIISAEPSDVTLRSEIRDPKGKIVSINELRDQFFGSFKPKYRGEYMIILNNKGTKSATIDAIFSQIPMISENDENRLNLLKGISVGIILVIIGILLIIGGGVILIMDKRKPKRTTSTRSE
jgi:hypothetical protein